MLPRKGNGCLIWLFVYIVCFLKNITFNLDKIIYLFIALGHEMHFLLKANKTCGKRNLVDTDSSEALHLCHVLWWLILYECTVLKKLCIVVSGITVISLIGWRQSVFASIAEGLAILQAFPRQGFDLGDSPG